MPKHISQCPKCHTSFRIDDEQLNSADGIVRCGECMHIYNARELLNQENTEAPSPIDIDDDCLIDDDFDLGNQNGDAAATANPTLAKHQNKSSIFDSDAPLYDEEFWGKQDRLSKDFELDIDTESIRNDAMFKDFDELKAYQEQRDNNDESEQQHQPQFDDVIAQISIDDIENDEDKLNASLNLLNNTSTAAIPITHENNTNYKASQSHSVFWLTGCVVAIIVLCQQIAITNFTKLSSNPNTRPLLEKVCQLTRCELPQTINLTQITATNLVVRSHSDKPDVLKVDLILNNLSHAEQAFPKLILEFSNLNNTVVAARVFNPNEYLVGELKGSLIMPIKQPIHLSLDIVDPGKQAMNYSVRLSPNN